MGMQVHGRQAGARTHGHAAARGGQRPHAQADSYEAESVAVLARLSEERAADEQTHLARGGGQRSAGQPLAGGAVNRSWLADHARLAP